MLNTYCLIKKWSFICFILFGLKGYKKKGKVVTYNIQALAHAKVCFISL